MGDVIPLRPLHSVNAKYHALWDITPASIHAVVEAELEDALIQLMDTQSDELDVDKRRLAITRYTLAAIRLHETGGDAA